MPDWLVTLIVLGAFVAVPVFVLWKRPARHNVSGRGDDAGGIGGAGAGVGSHHDSGFGLGGDAGHGAGDGGGGGDGGGSH